MPSKLNLLSAGAAHEKRWLADCLNADRRERLDPDQVLWILREGRKIGCHAAMHYLCADSGYSPSQPIEPKDELAELQRNFIEASKGMQRMAARIEQIQGLG